jgi:hypothetical protein
MLVLESYLVTVRRCLTKLTCMMILLGDCVTAKKDLKLESIDVVLDGFRHAVIARKHTHRKRFGGKAKVEKNQLATRAHQPLIQPRSRLRLPPACSRTLAYCTCESQASNLSYGLLSQASNS